MGLEEDAGARLGGKEVVPPSEVCSCCTAQGDMMVELAYNVGEINMSAEPGGTSLDTNTRLPMRDSSSFVQVLLP